MLSRPADRRTIDRGMVIRATATVRTNSMSSIMQRRRRQHVAEHGALDRHQRVDRHAFGMARQRRERVDEADAVLARLAHADDPAAADRDPGRCALPRACRAAPGTSAW